MLKLTIAATVLGLASLIAVPAALADVSVNVDTNSYGYLHRHHHHVVVAEAVHRHRHGHVYYNGDYAYVSRDNGATFVHAYPGVEVLVGSGGGVSVNVGY